MSDKVTTRARRGAPSEQGVSPRSDESMRRLHDKVSLLSMQRDYWKQRCTELSDSRNAVATELARRGNPRVRRGPGGADHCRRRHPRAGRRSHRRTGRWTDVHRMRPRGMGMVQIGVVDRPAAMLDRLGASLMPSSSPIVAHAECLHLN